MKRSDVTKDLTKKLHTQFGKKAFFAAFEVTIKNKRKNFGRVDYVIFEKLKTWRFYEIKSSVEDFRSDAKWTFLGHYNYFVMPYSVFEEVKDEIPSHVGVYVPDGNKLVSVKHARKQALVVDHDILLTRFIVSLTRDATKFREKKIK